MWSGMPEFQVSAVDLARLRKEGQPAPRQQRPPSVAVRARNAGAASAAPVYTFPAMLPAMVLLNKQRKESYAIPASSSPPKLEEQIGAFVEWSLAPVNADRGNTILYVALNLNTKRMVFF